MRYPMSPEHPAIRRIAKRLAVNEGCAERTQIDGFSVPAWILFVSEAQRLWETHTAVNDLDFDAKK